MLLYCGCSGFSHKEWKGAFYPDRTKNAAMSAHCGSNFDTGEINSTFYRMPKASVLEGWAEQVGDNFRFALKASRRITHIARLKEEHPPPGEM